MIIVLVFMSHVAGMKFEKTTFEAQVGDHLYRMQPTITKAECD